MSESTLEKMLHTAADLRARLDGAMTEMQRAVLTDMLATMEAGFRDKADQVRAIRARMPRRENAEGRATAAYVDTLLGERSGVLLH